MTRRKAPEVDYLLARLRMFGLAIVTQRGGTVHVAREGRTSTVDLEAVTYDAADPCDAYILSLALETEPRAGERETYIAFRPGDEEPMPVELALTLTEDGTAEMTLRHGLFGRDGDRRVVRSLDDLLDALPFLAPPNAVGYHRARERIIARYARCVRRRGPRSASKIQAPSPSTNDIA